MVENKTLVLEYSELESQFAFINSLIDGYRSSSIATVNTMVLRMNWDIGRFISSQLKSARWGTKVVGDLADYLKRQSPGRRGFGKRNLYNMVKFYDLYSRPSFIDRLSQLDINEIVQLPTAQFQKDLIMQLPTAQLAPTHVQKIPLLLTITTFTNHVEIMNRCSSDEERIFLCYMLVIRGLKQKNCVVVL